MSRLLPISAFLLCILVVVARGASVDNTTLSNKFLVGYQAWHASGGDGKALSGYVHWSHINRVQPSPTDVVMDMWPDLSEFTAGEQFATGYTLGNGQPAKAYSCYLTNTVVRHFKWMKDYGLDGAVLQRFTKDVFTDASWAALKNTNLLNCRLGAETQGRVFCLMYDISNEDPALVLSHLQSDWAYLTGTLHMTNSTSYLRHRGKPLLCLWGFGFSGGLTSTPSEAQTIINFFKTAGCTVLGGVPANWRTLNGDSQTNTAWTAVYHSFDVLSPWTVGRYTTEAQADSFKSSTLAPDLADCKANGVDYMPVVFPGYSAHNLGGTTLNGIPRNAGRFFWRQIYNALNAGSSMVYGAMFDEIDEGTALYKLAPTTNETPAAALSDQYQFFALNADGYSLPSDWYLRVTGQGTLATHDAIPLGAALPITPTNGVTLTSPNGGQTWSAGTTANITWSTTGVVNYINLDLSTDSGSTFRSLLYNRTNTGSATITVPYYASSNCLIRVASTANSPVDWSDAVFTLRITNTNPNLELQPLWSLAPGSRSDLPDSTANTARGLAYNAIADELYLVNVSGPTANILDGTTGTNKGSFNLTGVSAGSFVLDKIGVTGDGVVYAANVQTSISGSALFKVYRWVNPATAPTLAYSGTVGFTNGTRVGDLVAFRGCGTNTQILVGGRGVSNVALLTTTNGTNFTARAIVTDASPTQMGGALAFGAGNSFWGATNGLPPARLNFNPISLVATTAQAFSAAAFSPACGPMNLDPPNSLLAVVNLADGSDSLNLYDLWNPSNAPVLIASWTIPGTTDNNFGLGAIAFGRNRLYVLDTNNGLRAFKLAFPGGPASLSPVGSAGKVTLAWPASSRGFFLESRANLMPAGQWQSLCDPAAVVGSQLVVTQSTAGAGAYYRLDRP